MALEGNIFLAKLTKSAFALILALQLVKEWKFILYLFIRFVSSSIVRRKLTLGSTPSPLVCSCTRNYLSSTASYLAVFILGKLLISNFALSWFWQNKYIRNILASLCSLLYSSSWREAAQITFIFFVVSTELISFINPSNELKPSKSRTCLKKF